MYVGRLAMTAAIFLAAVFAWRDAEKTDTLVASLLIMGAMIFTAGSAVYSESTGVRSSGVLRRRHCSTSCW